jgi:hypothetical protein
MPLKKNNPKNREGMENARNREETSCSYVSTQAIDETYT